MNRHIAAKHKTFNNGEVNISEEKESWESTWKKKKKLHSNKSMKLYVADGLSNINSLFHSIKLKGQALCLCSALYHIFGRYC